jgi:hypothetical protein
MSTTLVEQIEKPVIVAETEEPEIVAGAITDGSQAIAHDGFDVETFEQAAGDYARLSRTVDETAGAIRTGPALLRDLFWSFHKRAPRIAPVAPLSCWARLGCIEVYDSERGTVGFRLVATGKSGKNRGLSLY